MRSVYLLLLVGIYAVAGSTSLREFCSQGKKCLISTNVPTEIPTDLTTTTHHKMVEFNFVYFTDVDYISNVTEKDSQNTIGIAIVIDNVMKDPCEEQTCWMRIRSKTDYPFVDPQLNGYYDYSNNTLSLYPQFIFTFPAHTVAANFSVSFETCIVNPLFDYNDCIHDLQHYGQEHIKGQFVATYQYF